MSSVRYCLGRSSPINRMSLNASTAGLPWSLRPSVKPSQHLAEQRDRLCEIPGAAAVGVVAAEQEQELVVHRLERRVVERPRVVAADLLEDARGLGQHARTRREPLEAGAAGG